MNYLTLIELLINAGLGALAQLKPSTSAADAKVAAELTAAIERLKAARQVVFDAPELESLRTKPLW
jgi:hypothetical protein